MTINNNGNLLNESKETFINFIEKELERGFDSFLNYCRDKSIINENQIDKSKISNYQFYIIKVLKNIDIQENKSYYYKRLLEILENKTLKDGIKNINLKENPIGYLAGKLIKTFEEYMSSKHSIEKTKKQVKNGVFNNLLNLIKK